MSGGGLIGEVCAGAWCVRARELVVRVEVAGVWARSDVVGAEAGAVVAGVVAVVGVLLGVVDLWFPAVLPGCVPLLFRGPVGE
jgi:hypothetical protein